MEMTRKNTSRYIVPQHWIRYDKAAILDLLIAAKTEAGILRQMPYLPQWIEEVHEEQLRADRIAHFKLVLLEFSGTEKHVLWLKT